jgi:hypothetical protein
MHSLLCDRLESFFKVKATERDNIQKRNHKLFKDTTFNVNISIIAPVSCFESDVIYQKDKDMSNGTTNKIFQNVI